jgi:bacterial/archaeal transporter family-2 protein
MQYIALAAIAGFFLPLQALINARTSQVFGNPLVTTTVNFAGGIVMMLIILAVMRTPVPTAEQVGKVPFYGWFAGLAGVLFVSQASITVPKLGAAAMIAVVIAGQLFASMVFDHFGILQQAHPISWQKILGAVLLLGGVWLILRPGR